MSTRELGVSTSVFKNFQPAEDLPLLRCNAISQVELSFNCFEHLLDAEKFRRLSVFLDDANVAVNSIHVPFRSASRGAPCSISDFDPLVRAEAIEMALICLERLQALNGRYLVIHSSTEPISREERARKIELCQKNLALLVSRFPAHSSVKIAVECLPRTCLGRDSHELIDIVDSAGSDRVGVCMDVNHANIRENVLDATRRYGSRILTLHISDNDGEDERHWLPLRGVIPWREWICALVDTGFDGPFLYEVSLAKEDTGQPLDAATVLGTIRRNAERVFSVNAR